MCGTPLTFGRNATFTYPLQKEVVLRDVSLKIEAGELVAIVGMLSDVSLDRSDLCYIYVLRLQRFWQVYVDQYLSWVGCPHWPKLFTYLRTQRLQSGQRRVSLERP